MLFARKKNGPSRVVISRVLLNCVIRYLILDMLVLILRHPSEETHAQESSLVMENEEAMALLHGTQYLA